MKSIAVLFAAWLLLLGGCATSSPIQPYLESKSEFDPPPVVMAHTVPDSDVYRIFHRGSTGFTSIQAIRSSAEQRAKAFCESRGKSMQVLGEKISEPPYILGNWPRIEIVFACVDRVSEPPLPTAIEDAKYRKLSELKKLLDNGTLTQQEFEREKARVLEGR